MEIKFKNMNHFYCTFADDVFKHSSIHFRNKIDFNNVCKLLEKNNINYTVEHENKFLRCPYKIIILKGYIISYSNNCFMRNYDKLSKLNSNISSITIK